MFSAIVSSSNPRVKRAVQLKRVERGDEKDFLIDGIREVERAWQSDLNS